MENKAIFNMAVSLSQAPLEGWLITMFIKCRNSDEDGRLRASPAWTTGSGEKEVKETHVSPSLRALWLVSRVSKAEIAKAPLIFVSSVSDPAWLGFYKAWWLLGYSGHFLGGSAALPERAHFPQLRSETRLPESGQAAEGPARPSRANFSWMGGCLGGKLNFSFPKSGQEGPRYS